jgi:hypothetical protein
MNAPLHSLYTNEVSPEFLRNLDAQHFTEERLANCCDETLAVVRQQQDYIVAHPARAVYRLATEGSQTRDGGVIQQATSPFEFTLGDGTESARGTERRLRLVPRWAYGADRHGRGPRL